MFICAIPITASALDELHINILYFWRPLGIAAAPSVEFSLSSPGFLVNILPSPSLNSTYCGSSMGIQYNQKWVSLILRGRIIIKASQNPGLSCPCIQNALFVVVFVVKAGIWVSGTRERGRGGREERGDSIARRQVDEQQKAEKLPLENEWLPTHFLGTGIIVLE